MQQLLQQHVLSPTQLQSLMKQHSLLQQQQQQQVRGVFKISICICNQQLFSIATPVSRTWKEANRTDHAAVAGTTPAESNPTNAHFTEQRQEEGVWVVATARVATATHNTTVAADAAAIRRPSGDGDAAADVAPSDR